VLNYARHTALLTLCCAGHGYDRDSRREDVRRDDRDRRAPPPASANFDRRDRCDVWRVACCVLRVACGVWRVTCDVCSPCSCVFSPEVCWATRLVRPCLLL
jgi:hypothetical protein